MNPLLATALLGACSSEPGDTDGGTEVAKLVSSLTVVQATPAAPQKTPARQSEEEARAAYLPYLPVVEELAKRYSQLTRENCANVPLCPDQYFSPPPDQVLPYPPGVNANPIGALVGRQFSAKLFSDPEKKNEVGTSERFAVSMPIQGATCTVQWSVDFHDETTRELLVHYSGTPVYLRRSTYRQIDESRFMVTKQEEPYPAESTEAELYRYGFDQLLPFMTRQ